MAQIQKERSAKGLLESNFYLWKANIISFDLYPRPQTFVSSSKNAIKDRLEDNEARKLFWE